MGYCPTCNIHIEMNREIRFTENGSLCQDKECPTCGECTGGKMIFRGVVADEYNMSIAYDDPELHETWLDALGVVYPVEEGSD